MTNPMRSQPLRDDDCIYCFLAPRHLKNERLHVLEGKGGVVAAAPPGQPAVEGEPSLSRMMGSSRCRCAAPTGDAPLPSALLSVAAMPRSPLHPHAPHPHSHAPTKRMHRSTHRYAACCRSVASISPICSRCRPASFDSLPADSNRSVTPTPPPSPPMPQAECSGTHAVDAAAPAAARGSSGEEVGLLLRAEVTRLEASLAAERRRADELGRLLELSLGQQKGVA